MTDTTQPGNNPLDEILTDYATPYYASGNGKLSHDDAKAAIERYALSVARRELEEFKLHDWGDDDMNVLISELTDNYIDEAIDRLQQGSGQ